MNEQRSKYNQKQTEKAAREELKLRAEETQVLEDQGSPTVEVTKEEVVESQTEVSDVQEKPSKCMIPTSTLRSWENVSYVNYILPTPGTTITA